MIRSSDETVQDALQGFVEFQLVGGVGIDLLDFAIEAFEDGHAFADFVEREQMRFVAVVEVGGVVGDLVGQVDELGFERRTLVEQIFGEFRMFLRAVVVRVLDDAFADFEGQVQAAEGGVALFEIFDDAQGVQVVVEEAVRARAWRRRELFRRRGRRADGRCRGRGRELRRDRR